jgi:hypothetical protein
MKIGICHAHHIPLAHVELAGAIVAAGHEPVVIGGPYEEPPTHDLIYGLIQATEHIAPIFPDAFKRDTGVVRNPALPKRPTNNGGSRYF